MPDGAADGMMRVGSRGRAGALSYGTLRVKGKGNKGGRGRRKSSADGVTSPVSSEPAVSSVQDERIGKGICHETEVGGGDAA